MILFLDDVQWAEPATLKLLHYLSRNTRKNKMMIIATYRPEDIIQSEEGRTHPLKTTMQNMSREVLYREIRLKRLDERWVGELIEKSLKKVDLDEGFIKKIYTESEGNPFFLLEVVRMLVEEGHLVEGETGWKMANDLAGLNIPSKVYDVVSRRIDRLIEEHRELLECASVVGEEFESVVIGDIIDTNRVTLLKNLNYIEKNHNLIHSLNRKYRFDHSKIREVLYNGIIEELREEFHCMIAETYEKMQEEGRNDLTYELAIHWDKGGLYQKAFEYYKKAAKMSKDSYANKQAIECLDRILDILPNVENLDDREIQRIHYLHEKGDCLKTIGEWNNAEKVYMKSLEIAEKIEDLCKMAECKNKLGDIQLREAKYDESLRLFKEASEIYIDIDDEKGYCDSLGRIGSVYNSLSEYDKAMEILNEMRVIAEKLHDTDLMSKLYGALGSTHYGRGELSESMNYYSKKLEIKEKEGDLLEIGYTLVNLASLYLRMQEYDKCMSVCKQALDIVEKTGDKLMEQNALGKLGIAYAEQGIYSKGLEYYKKKLALSEKIGDRRSVAYVANNIGELYKEKGEYEKALEYYQKDVEISKELGDKKGYAITMGNMGNLYKLMGDFERSDELYDETISIARTHDIKDVLSYFLADKADLYFLKKDIERAEDLNEEAINIAESVNMSKAVFNAGLLKAKIISTKDPTRGIELLKSMLKEEHIRPEKAELLYELYNISGDETYKKDALDFYRDLFEKNPSIHYKEMIERLEK